MAKKMNEEWHIILLTHTSSTTCTPTQLWLPCQPRCSHPVTVNDHIHTSVHHRDVCCGAAALLHSHASFHSNQAAGSEHPKLLVRQEWQPISTLNPNWENPSSVLDPLH